MQFPRHWIAHRAYCIVVTCERVLENLSNWTIGSDQLDEQVKMRAKTQRKVYNSFGKIILIPPYICKYHSILEHVGVKSNILPSQQRFMRFVRIRFLEYTRHIWHFFYITPDLL